VAVTGLPGRFRALGAQRQMKHAIIRFMRWTMATRPRYAWIWGVLFWGGGTTLLTVPALWPKEPGLYLFLDPCMAIGGYFW
jgi:hypothetical protein